MKKSGKCPKCGCEEIIFILGYNGPYGAGNNIRVGLTTMSSVLVNRYVCSECGYSEEWIDKVDIDKLKKKYN